MRLGHNATLARILSRLAAWYVILLAATTRRRVIGIESAWERVRRGEPLLIGFWHSRMVMMPSMNARYLRGARLKVLVSRSRDGGLIASVLKHLRLPTITGSTSRGAAAALRAIVDSLNDGTCVAVTPDGPRGPRMRAQVGIVHAAKLAGVPIYLFAFSATRMKVFRSWDRFVLPLPFCRVVFVCKGPIMVAADADEAAIAAARREVETCLNQATREADRLCGQIPIEPAPLPTSETRQAAVSSAGEKASADDLT